MAEETIDLAFWQRFCTFWNPAPEVIAGRGQQIMIDEKIKRWNPLGDIDDDDDDDDF